MSSPSQAKPQNLPSASNPRATSQHQIVQPPYRPSDPSYPSHHPSYHRPNPSCRPSNPSYLKRVEVEMLREWWFVTEVNDTVLERIMKQKSIPNYPNLVINSHSTSYSCKENLTQQEHMDLSITSSDMLATSMMYVLNASSISSMTLCLATKSYRACCDAYPTL